MCALSHDYTHTDEWSICPESLGDRALLQWDCVSHAEGEETGVCDHDPIIDAEPDGGNREGHVNVSADQTLGKAVALATHLSSVAKTLPPLSSAMIPIIFCNLLFAPTPPTMSTSLDPM